MKIMWPNVWTSFYSKLGQAKWKRPEHVPLKSHGAQFSILSGANRWFLNTADGSLNEIKKYWCVSVEAIKDHDK